MLIDEVFHRRQQIHWCAERHRHAANRDFPAEAHHHGHVARNIERLHESLLTCLGHGAVIGLKERELRHIAAAAIGVARGDLELLRRLGLHRGAGGLHDDVFERRLIFLRIRHALGNPAHERLVLLGAGLQFLPARVRHDGSALGDEQAFLRCRREYPAALSLLHDGFIILLGLETEHAEPKAALAGDRLGMAHARVAARLRQDGLHVTNKAEWSRRFDGEARSSEHRHHPGAGEGFLWHCFKPTLRTA